MIAARHAESLEAVREYFRLPCFSDTGEGIGECAVYTRDLLATLGKQIPYSFAGLGCGDRPHAPGEFITIDSVEQLMHWTVDYLDDRAALLKGQASAPLSNVAEQR